MTSITSVSFINLLKSSSLLVRHRHINLQLHAHPFTYNIVKITARNLRNFNLSLTSNPLTCCSMASTQPPPEFPQRQKPEVDPTTPLEMPEMPRDPQEIDPTPPEFIIPTPPGEVGPSPAPPDPTPNPPGPEFPQPPIPSPPGPDVVPRFPGVDPLPREPPDVVPPTPPEVFPPPLTPPPDIVPPTGPIIV